MPSVSAIQNRIDRALNKVTPTNRLVYKRVVTTIGDTLIGRTTSSKMDILLSPQPSVDQTGREHLSGVRDAVETVISSTGERDVRDDYVLNISTTAMTKDELRNKNVYLVFKTGLVEEVLYIMDFEPIEYKGTILVNQVYARSVKTT